MILFIILVNYSFKKKYVSYLEFLEVLKYGYLIAKYQ